MPWEGMGPDTEDIASGIRVVELQARHRKNKSPCKCEHWWVA